MQECRSGEVSRLDKVRIGGRVFGSQAKRLNRVQRESDRERPDKSRKNK